MMNNSIGVQIVYRTTTDLDKEIKKAKDMELESCQLCKYIKFCSIDWNIFATRNNISGLAFDMFWFQQ